MTEYSREPAWDEQADPLPDEAVNEPVAAEPVIFFRGIQVAGFNLLLDMSVICEIVDRPPVSRVPNTPAWLLGLANHRGVVVPVFDLARAFSSERKEQRNTSRRLLIIGTGETAVAVITDELPLLIDFTASDLREDGATLPTALAKYLIGRYQKDGVDWFMFDYLEFFEGLAEGTATA